MKTVRESQKAMCVIVFQSAEMIDDLQYSSEFIKGCPGLSSRSPETKSQVEAPSQPGVPAGANRTS